MTATTEVVRDTLLPLTCSRTGSCCHGKLVWISPWELAHLATAKDYSPREFRDTFCDDSGIRLRFSGSSGWKGLPTCSQYDPDSGCTVHTGRPLACRLYPLGRELQGNDQRYIFHGEQFPCFEGCPEVKDLPQQTVFQYLEEQHVESFQSAQELYLRTMESLADGAFALFFESGLAEMGDRITLETWHTMSHESPPELAHRIGNRWLDCITIPTIPFSEDPFHFIQQHSILLQEQAQHEFGACTTVSSFQESAIRMMAMALYLGRSLGVPIEAVANHWITTAYNELHNPYERPQKEEL